jgi:dihydrofolate reductase
MTPSRVIGINNNLPWRLPADLAHFKAVTLGKPIIMGRHTFLSIGRPLPGRDNWIISTTLTEAPPGTHLASNLADVLQTLTSQPDILIIGGGQLYQAALCLADKLLLTIVDTDIPGDTYFPEWSHDIWQLTDETLRAADKDNPYPLRFQTWIRCP